jgi:hypothetical protein
MFTKCGGLPFLSESRRTTTTDSVLMETDCTRYRKCSLMPRIIDFVEDSRFVVREYSARWCTKTPTEEMNVALEFVKYEYKRSLDLDDVISVSLHARGAGLAYSIETSAVFDRRGSDAVQCAVRSNMPRRCFRWVRRDFASLSLESCCCCSVRSFTHSS